MHFLEPFRLFLVDVLNDHWHHPSYLDHVSRVVKRLCVRYQSKVWIEYRDSYKPVDALSIYSINYRTDLGFVFKWMVGLIMDLTGWGLIVLVIVVELEVSFMPASIPETF